MTAPRFEMKTLREGYVELCRHLDLHGRRTAPRGLECLEVTGATLVIHDVTRDTMPVGLNRGVNVAIGAAEALQLVGGVSTPRLLARIAPAFERYMDGEVLAGAYGPRIRWQVPEVVERLVSDRDTRQAVISIWDPRYDLYGVTRDVPCTLGFQFLIRDDELEMHVTMRSNDVWRGLAYDVAQFSALHLTLADAVNVTPGPLVHRVGSLHLYTSDLEATTRLDELGAYAEVPPLGLPGFRTVLDAQERARVLLTGALPHRASLSERWYAETLAPYV